MSSSHIPAGREGSLEAPTRHPLNWRDPSFYDEQALETELERVFDICHGCRRCFSLCQSFPTLFDAIDESPTSELDGVDKKDADVVAKAPTFANLTKLAIDHSDAVIKGAAEIDSDVEKYIKKSGKPSLEYHSKEDYIDAYSEFYDAVLAEVPSLV
jgi:hypothetical protein